MNASNRAAHLGPVDLVATAVPDLRVVGLQRLALGGKWRVEAMRSYSRPVLLWFTRGQGRITVAGTTRGYGPHNAIFLPAGTMHGFDMLGQVLGSAVFLPNDALLDWPDEPAHLRIRDVRQQSELTSLIDSIETEMAKDDAIAMRAALHHAGLMSVWLARTMDNNPTAANAGVDRKAADRIAAAFTSMVEKAFRTAKPIATYARELGVTPTHLTRACNATSGRSASNILMERRLYEARKMLAETKMPVKSIASELGFKTPAYFTRMFHAQTGVTPTQFRNAPARRH
ncbi:MAG: AraC family transcriptional regulator [Pseudomonadota bacterium]